MSCAGELRGIFSDKVSESDSGLKVAAFAVW
jgi:hypothetical protein